MHGGLRLNRAEDFGFAARAHSVPPGLGELEVAAQDYPILFASSADPVPVALLGLWEGGWRSASEVPAYCRAYPFVFVHTGACDTTFAATEADAACLRRDVGAPLLASGKPAASLQQAIACCDSYRADAIAAEAFARALAGQGLLEAEAATISFSGGGCLRIDGFQVLGPERLGNLADETFLDWRSCGWLSRASTRICFRWGAGAG